jgi:hypothetical protein
VRYRYPPPRPLCARQALLRCWFHRLRRAPSLRGVRQMSQLRRKPSLSPAFLRHATRRHRRPERVSIYALISFTTLCADSIAPCIDPFHRDVCSPAKKIRPSLRAFTGIQLSSPGPNDVRPPRCHGSSIQLFARTASNYCRAPGNTPSASASVCCTRLCTSMASSFAALSPMIFHGPIGPKFCTILAILRWTDAEAVLEGQGAERVC